MKRIAKYLFTLLISISVFLIGVNYVNAESSAGEILLSKTASKKDLEKGRSADVTLTVNANGFTTVDKTDVVLVLDRSSSMDGTPMENTKTAAKDLIELLITDKTKDNTRAAIVTYGSDLLTSYTSNSLTNDVTTLKDTINSIPSSINNEGTNVHAGLLKAEELLRSSGTDTQKIIILLSDGEPTFYLGSNNKLCGFGRSDRPDYSLGCTVNGNNRPSTVADAEATTIKNSGTKIYTVGFRSGADMTFLGNIASNPTEKYSYTASDYEGLKETFKKIVNDFTTVATDAVVTDIVPAGFQIKKGTLPAVATAIENKDGTTTITWVIGDIKSTATNSLTYTVEAKKGEYGSMYTNVSATINAKSVDGNPKYGSSNPISLDFDKPYVPIPGVTVKDDYYDIKQGTTFITPAEKGILDNDELTHKNLDENATVTDRIVLVYDNETNGKAENITLNQDGTFSYNATKDTLGEITYKYYVETTVTIDGKSQVVRSNVTTITLNVIKNPTKYVVNYLEKGTDKVLHDAKSEDGNVYDEIKLADVIMTIKGYNYDSVNVDPLVLSDNTVLNVMNIYYTKRTDLSYTVNYLEKDTNKVLNQSKVVNDVKFETVINGRNEVITIDGYVFNSVNPEKLVIDVENNVINIYYTKRTDLSYTVNYLEKDTNVVLNQSKEVNDVEFETVINGRNEIIDITGYEFDSLNPEKLVIDVENNVINIYYTKRTDLSYTVNYLEKDTNVVLNQSKEVNDVKFETVINGRNEIIDITGYEFDSLNPEKLVIDVENNVINIYYTKRTDLSYTVNYLEKDTNVVLNQSKEVNNVKFETVINGRNEIIDITGYEFDSLNPEKLVIDVENNVINIYYTKRTDLSYTVNYLEKDTNVVLNQSKEVNDVEFETVINGRNEIIDITGYEFDSLNPEKLVIDVENNVINIYYTKRTDLSYTVNYLEKDTNVVLNQSKEVNDVKFETVINGRNEIIDITGYEFDSLNPEKLVIDVENNVINIYYTKRTDLSYTVNYLEKDTNVVLNQSKEVNNVKFETVINGRNEIIDITGYEFDSLNPEKLVIDVENNVINIYYTKRTDLSYTVNYLEKDTNVVLNQSKEVNNVKFETVINGRNEIIDITGYEFDSLNPEKLVIDVENNVINIYYTKRTDLSYTVNYLEKDTNVVLNQSKEVNDVEFETVINGRNEIIDITGYEFDSLNPEKLVIDVENNVINIYYTKRTDLSYTVNYLEKDTNVVLNQSKEVNNVKFETVINGRNEIIDITGYEFDSLNPEKLVIDVENNVINIYYTKRTDLSYTVNYLEKDTNVVLNQSKEVNDVEFETVINGRNEIIDITGYEFDSLNPEKLVIDVENNVINIYYTKRTDLSYTVNYLEKDTNVVLNQSKEVNNVKFETVINGRNEIIDITGYEFDSLNPEKLVIDVENNVINIYYTKRTDLSYTVNYLEKDTNVVLNQSKEVNNVKFETVINGRNEIIDITGYEFDSLNPEKLVIDVENNVINIYYTKRTDLSYTVNYLEKDTNVVLNQSKEVNDVEFETVINGRNEIIDITGYEFDSLNPEKLTIGTDSNVINIYYTVLHGTVKVKYVDSNDKEIIEPEIIKGQVGTDYEIKAKEIAKYKLSKVVGNEKGKYIDGELVVTYVYETIPDTGVYASDYSVVVSVMSIAIFMTLVFFKKKMFN